MIDLLKSMAIFSEVARLGSFRAAAKSQNVSPSVISRHVSSLENNLGEVLLNRSTRKLALTSVGEKFLIHCNQMLQSANEGITSVKDNINKGHLSITLPVTLTTPKFGQLIKAFRAANPHVDFSLSFNDDNVDIVKKGMDIALRLGPLEDSSLKAKRITTIHRSIICTPQYYESVGEITDPGSLNQCFWIGRKNPSIIPNIHSPNGEIYTIPKQKQFIQVNSVEAIKSFVLSHNGIGLFTDILVEQELAEGKVLRLLPEWRVESMPLYAVWSAQKTTGQLVKKFVSFLSKEFNALEKR